jgi:elongation factor P
MATTSDIRKGMCINHSSDTFIVIDFLHVKPGKGNAFVRTKLKSITTGKVLDHTFSAGHKVDDVRVERKRFQFLYSDEEGYHFMDVESYEQITMNENFLPAPKLLKEGFLVDVLFHAAKNIPLTCEMPQYVTLEVTYTERGVKGDTATNASKPATVETGAEVRVPLFIQVGDIIKINTEDSSYMERVKQ